VAVGRLAVETCGLHVRLNSDLLVTAALVHDLGKTEEFTYGADIGLTEAGRMVGHVELGLRLLDGRARRTGLDEERWLARAHGVLSHHGPAAASSAPRRSRCTGSTRSTGR
jgi:3'-5' exoribonuclease